MSPTVIVIFLFSALGGILIGWVLNDFAGTKSRKAAKKQIADLIEEAKLQATEIKNEKLIETDDEIYEKRLKLEDEIRTQKNALKQYESSLNEKENEIDRKADLISKKERDIFIQQREIQNKDLQIGKKQEKLNKMLEDENLRLEQISGYTTDQAKQVLFDNLIDGVKKEAENLSHQIIEKSKQEAFQKAKNIVLSAIQQTAVDHALESTVSIVSLPSDDMKGRIIGREGRNIRSFEVVTGIDVIVDDTPQAVILSGYDPLRREAARLTMEKLVNDGRIHPGRIEETHEKTLQEMENYFNDLGEQALLETGVHAMHPELTKTLGKLRFRTSYGQNILQHSKEVAVLAGMMAAELGLDQVLAKRAGLLHDIGMGIDRHTDGNHAELGYDFAKKYGETPIILNAILTHHGEGKQISPISVLVEVANEISSSRPGARRDVVDKFIQRMENIENIAQSFEGVEKVYAIQAGKEVRIIINHSNISDSGVHQLAGDIARKIQTGVDYPGQIKVTIIREFRAVDFA